MSKIKQLHHIWRYIKLVRPLYFILTAVVWAVIAVFALRANNQHMLELRDKVFETDKAGSLQEVEASLKNLQAYVTTHMNTDLTTSVTGVYPPIQLQYTYQRYATNQGTTNNDLYTQAQQFCQSQNSSSFSGRDRVPCIEQYVLDHGAKPKHVDPSLYEFNFVSPRWSPDLAGWSIVLAAGSLLLATITLITDWNIRRQLN